jgi:hypothetical protein
VRATYVAPPRAGGGVKRAWSTTSWTSSTPLGVLAILTVAQGAGPAGAAADRRSPTLTYAERKVLGADAAAPGSERRWVRSACSSRFADAIEDADEGDGASRRAPTACLFLMAPMLTFMLAMLAWAVIPVNDGWAIADINVGVLVPVRDQLARRLWRDHRRLGLELEDTPSSARCVRRRRWCQLRSLDGLRHRHRADCRQPAA